MFELTSGTADRPFRDPHTVAAGVSLMVHALVLGGSAWVVLFSVTQPLPEVPTMMAFVAELLAAAPPPPPPPPPPAKRTATAPQPKVVRSSEPVFTAPAEIPAGIEPEAAFDPGDEGGEVGGVEGGIAGGIVGGVLEGIAGGIVDETPPPPPPPAKPVRVGGNIVAPHLIHRVEPDYPPIAVSAKVTGTVILEATVDRTGKVTDVKMLRSILMLDEAAIKAVRQWKYEPLLIDGQPVPFILVVTLTFSLR